ncbi:hypothetical protein JAAARDRAFT_174140 [Jaapia argillacea MUCL 33604]|uniref:MYND-type domain-containing protein n=1 Tax=Jaapia argillacea MUCL 33604 TaxID=933084 RepID=A0A067Q9E4_9AGAM|nr:hypothetical protein JAAARDRAFT_174140 [Jaapia argillacea MUCL 33604]
MPGPSSKKKSKPKSKQSGPRTAPQPTTRPDDLLKFFSDLDSTETWGMTVAALCDYFELPDLTTRHGLKKVHANFDDIYRRLDTAYQKNPGNERLVGGIVGIYAKMCADSILRDKLFKAGFLSKLFPLIDIPGCCHMALRALSTVTHHGGVAVRTDIAKRTPALVRLLQECPSDPKVADLSIAVMSHALGSVLAVDEKPGPDMRVVKSLQLPSILRVVIEQLQKPYASQEIISHALGIFSGATLHCWKECNDFPPVITFLVAFLRSTDLTCRCEALGALIRLHHAVCEPDQRLYDPQKMIAGVQRGFPPYLSEVMMEYGPTRCDVYATMQSTLTHQKAMMKCAQDRDLYACGKVLGQLIPSTEFSIAEGGYQAQNERTGRWEMMDIGLPFKMWTDALPHCAKALRASGISSDADMADIIEIKYLIVKQRIPDAIELALKAIRRSPEVAYYYYAITLGADGERGLRYAKKGAKCKQITPFVRFAMIHRAVDHAGNMALTMLTSTHTGERKWEEGVAFLTCAWEDAKTFIEEGPPDSRHMKNMLNWYILLTLVVKGPEMSPDLRELDDAFKKLKINEEIGTFLGYRPPNTELRLTRLKIVQLYASAIKDWGEVISKFDLLNSSPVATSVISPTKAEDDLATWLEDINLEDDDHVHSSHCSHGAHPKVSAMDGDLYRCSWCRNPSAILRKCGGCSKTRYCDSACQKSHWSTHKKTCKPA